MMAWLPGEADNSMPNGESATGGSESTAPLHSLRRRLRMLSESPYRRYPIQAIVSALCREVQLAANVPTQHSSPQVLRNPSLPINMCHYDRPRRLGTYSRLTCHRLVASIQCARDGLVPPRWCSVVHCPSDGSGQILSRRDRIQAPPHACMLTMQHKPKQRPREYPPTPWGANHSPQGAAPPQMIDAGVSLSSGIVFLSRAHCTHNLACHLPLAL